MGSILQLLVQISKFIRRPFLWLCAVAEAEAPLRHWSTVENAEELLKSQGSMKMFR